MCVCVRAQVPDSPAARETAAAFARIEAKKRDAQWHKRRLMHLGHEEGSTLNIRGVKFNDFQRFWEPGQNNIEIKHWTSAEAWERPSVCARTKSAIPYAQQRSARKPDWERMSGIRGRPNNVRKPLDTFHKQSLWTGVQRSGLKYSCITSAVPARPGGEKVVGMHLQKPPGKKKW